MDSTTQNTLSAATSGKAKEVEKPVKRMLLFIGYRWTGKEPKRGVAWYRLDNIAENDGNSISGMDINRLEIYTPSRGRKNLVQASPGMIFEFEAPNADRVYGSTGRFVADWANEDDVARWQAGAAAFEIDYDLHSSIAKRLKLRLDLRALEPFRKAWWNTRTKRDQACLLAMIVGAITQTSELR